MTRRRRRRRRLWLRWMMPMRPWRGEELLTCLPICSTMMIRMMTARTRTTTLTLVVPWLPLSDAASPASLEP
jgi:hypothetical protein